MTELKKILAAIPRLGTDEQAQVQAALEAARAFGTAPATNDATTDEMLVLEAIATSMARACVDMTSAAQLRKTSGYPAFRKKVPALMAMFARSKLTRTETRNLLSLGVDLIYESMVRQEITISSRAIMNHIHRMPSAFDTHFPGYARAGLLGLLTRPKAVNANED